MPTKLPTFQGVISAEHLELWHGPALFDTACEGDVCKPLKINLAIPIKFNKYMRFDPEILLLGTYPIEIKAPVQRNVCMQESLLQHYLLWRNIYKRSKHPFMEESLHKLE